MQEKLLFKLLLLIFILIKLTLKILNRLKPKIILEMKYIVLYLQFISKK